MLLYIVNAMESHDRNERDSFQQLFIVDAIRFHRFAQARDVRAGNPRLRTSASDRTSRRLARADLDIP